MKHSNRPVHHHYEISQSECTLSIHSRKNDRKCKLLNMSTFYLTYFDAIINILQQNTDCLD